MSKNVVIFSDGTGARGGVFFDERRSNVYKLFRATRSGPDSAVDPRAQLAFYDPGIGTLPPGEGVVGGIWRRIYNLVSQALGLGLTRNIIDCYAALIRFYRPGDRIFLFGFSRGAYAVRCLGGVLALCGLPTTGRDGAALTMSKSAARRIAREAVKKVYQHTSSWDPDSSLPRYKELLVQRKVRARRFRRRYGASDMGKANVAPHFIGVFDTVASLSNPVALVLLVLSGITLTAFVGFIAWLWLPWLHATPLPFSLLGPPVAAGLAGGLANFIGRIRWEADLPRRDRWRLFHLTERRTRFYDTTLSPRVAFARHALAIDEARGSFPPVLWTEPGTRDDERPCPDATSMPWFDQVWFAGVHSDIGGGYDENEARLSDIALAWLIDAACRAGLSYDASLLRLHGDPTGAQHDERRASLIFRLLAPRMRTIASNARLHPSVFNRLRAGNVLVYDTYRPYCPQNLRVHSGAGPLISCPPAAAEP